MECPAQPKDPKNPDPLCTDPSKRPESPSDGAAPSAKAAASTQTNPADAAPGNGSQATNSSQPGQQGTAQSNPVSPPQAGAVMSTQSLRTMTPWQACWNHPWPFLFGWLATALAATLGAPFWFDVLNRIMVIRSTVKPHQKSPEEASEDRQAPAGTTAAQTPAAPAPVPVQAAQASPPAPNPPAAPGPMDLMDGCDVQVTSATKDEDLPLALGGIS